MSDNAFNFEITAGDFAAAGEASSKIKSILKSLGIKSDIIRKAAIASYETELNMIIHSLGGNMELAITANCIEISSHDVGPGIDNVEAAMTEGFSTAPDSVRIMGFGAGMGLPNIKRCADEFSIDSIVGKGTDMHIRINI